MGRQGLEGTLMGEDMVPRGVGVVKEHQKRPGNHSRQRSTSPAPLGASALAGVKLWALKMGKFGGIAQWALGPSLVSQDRRSRRDQQSHARTGSDFRWQGEVRKGRQVEIPGAGSSPRMSRAVVLIRGWRPLFMGVA